MWVAIGEERSITMKTNIERMEISQTDYQNGDGFDSRGVILVVLSGDIDHGYQTDSRKNT